MLTQAAFTDKAGRAITIREAEEPDALGVIALVRQVDRESTFLSREPGEFATNEVQERQHISMLRGRTGSIMLVALHEGEIIGAIDFNGGTRRRTAHAGEFGLSVRRPYWGCGVGGALLDAMLDWARGTGVLHKVRLRVQDRNEAAIALYRSRGFVEEGRLARELRVDGEWVDLLVMGLWLP
jgi:RimJ/RimL family protein N-acetyltransferase